MSAERVTNHHEISELLQVNTSMAVTRVMEESILFFIYEVTQFYFIFVLSLAYSFVLSDTFMI